MLPFSQLERYEGNQDLFDLTLMSIVSSYAGEPLHIHAEGLRGTGKTTILRGSRDILPKITRIKDCIYNCDPLNPHCPKHKHLNRHQINDIGTEQISMPFLEISHSAKVGTVSGSIDLRSLTDPQHPEARLLPGLIPQAHRGIIFIDEINRLADTSPEITDILLDVMGNKPGHIQIEEAGLPTVEIMVNVSIWAASNPDEDPGPLEEIRRQLSDRFDMVCYMGRPNSVDILAHILRENSHTNQLRSTNYSKGLNDHSITKIKNQIIEWAEIYEQTDLPDFLRKFIARLYISNNLESIRAIEAIQQGAALASVIRNRNKASIKDVSSILPLALKHRVDNDTMTRIVSNIEVREQDDRILSLKGFIKKGEKEKDYFQPKRSRLSKLHRRDKLI